MAEARQVTNRVTLPGDDGAPVTATVTVRTVAVRRENDFLGERVGLFAHLEIAVAPDTEPHTYFVSRLVDEPYWVTDDLFRPNGYPVFVHGFGCRYVKARGLPAEVTAPADDYARAIGMVEAIGEGVPLVLSAGR